MIDYGYGVELRALERRDVPTLRRWRNDPLIRSWTRQNDELMESQHEAWFESLPKRQDVRMYAIQYDPKVKEGRILAGVCGLTSLDRENRRAEFSLYIGPEYQKSGLGRSALSTLFHHAFMTLNLNCVWGETFDGNPAAKMFEKIGMTKEGTRRAFYYRDGKYLDAHLYSILRGDWDRQLSDGGTWVVPPGSGITIPGSCVDLTRTGAWRSGTGWKT